MRRLGFGRRVEEEPSEEQEYWMSISDLMAGLLMVFALMLLAALYQYQSGVEGIREIVSVRDSVVQDLKDEFDSREGQAINVDENGVVRFADNVLFGQGSATVSPDGREQLTAFARRYLSVLLGNELFRTQLRSIVIEGHTNDDGSYEYNLDLSQRRALSVMIVLLGESGDFREDLQELVTANGRSFSDLLYLNDQDSVVDKEGSRRIEIHFRLNDDELLEQILDRVFSPAGDR